MITVLEGGEGSASRPGRSLSAGKTWYPLYRRLRGLQGRSGQVRKISPPPGFDPRTVQPIVSCYTDYANRPTCRKWNNTYLSGSVVIMLTGPPTGRTWNPGSIAGGVKRVFSSPKLPDHIWFSLRFLLIGYWRMFSGSRADHWFHIVSRLGMSGTIYLLRYILSRLGQEQFYLTSPSLQRRIKSSYYPF
jgi:hypothetical protein